MNLVLSHLLLAFSPLQDTDYFKFSVCDKLFPTYLSVVLLKILVANSQRPKANRHD